MVCFMLPVIQICCVFFRWHSLLEYSRCERIFTGMPQKYLIEHILGERISPAAAAKLRSWDF